jgi:hypothetical protein
MNAEIGVRLFLCSFLALFISQVALAAGSRDLGNVAEDEAQRELGGMRGSYFIPNHLVSEQISMGLSRPNPILRLAHGTNLISGCRLHSCDEKAAVVVTDDGLALAFSLIHYSCRRVRDRAQDVRSVCADKPRQDIFLKRRSVDVENDLRTWAQREVGPMQVEVRVIR